MDGPVPPLWRAVPAAVESLPWALGGLQRADIPLQIDALQAKVAALLLHPRVRPWKVLMRRAFERMVPALGPAVLVSSLRPVLCAGRSPRHVGLWRALHALRPHRLVEPGAVSVYHALRERLACSWRVTTPACPAGLRPSDSRLVRLMQEHGVGPTIAGLRQGLSDSATAGLARLAGRLKAMVSQPEWLRVLDLEQDGLPPPEWRVSRCGAWVRREAQGGAAVFGVRPDGRLAACAALAPPRADLAEWEPACVSWCPVGKGQRLLVALQPPGFLLPKAPGPGGGAARHPEAGAGGDVADRVLLQPYLLGPWRSVWVDPNVWGFGDAPLSAFVVRAAARRLLLISHCRATPGFSLLGGHCPRLWGRPGGTGGVLGLEARWAAVLSDRLRRLPVGAGGRSGVRRPRVDAAADHGLPFRVGWTEEAQGCLRRVPRRGLPQPADAVDVLHVEADGRVQRPPWCAAYMSLRCSRLDRLTRHFGWLLLHGALRCGASLLARCCPESRAALFREVCCVAACCSGGEDGDLVPPLDSFSHLFLECPVVAPAVAWLRGLWARISEGPEPPLDVRVLVVGDHTVWRPAGGRRFEELWLHLRLLFCRAVWVLHSRRAVHGQPFSAAAVASLTASWVGLAVRRDWLRVCVTLGGVAALPSWCVVSQRYALSQDEFCDRWCLGEVLAHVDPGGAFAPPGLRVHVPRL